jgi:hypothetical protein
VPEDSTKGKQILSVWGIGFCSSFEKQNVSGSALDPGRLQSHSKTCSPRGYRDGIWGGICFFLSPCLKDLRSYEKQKTTKFQKCVDSVSLKNTPKPKMNAKMTRYYTD